METLVPPSRITLLNDAPVNPLGDYVLYWMTAARRPRFNFALERAIDWARDLGKPLVVFEGLRCEYPWASDRLHRFVIDGMADNAAYFAGQGVTYHAYVEPAVGAGRGLLRTLAEPASVIVADEFPCFFLPRMLSAAARQMPVKMEQIDSNGLLPLRASEAAFPTAYAFRRFLQKTLPMQLGDFPLPDPIPGAELIGRAKLPALIGQRWPMASAALLDGAPGELASLPLDHRVDVVPSRGGFCEATRRLRAFELDNYFEWRNQPERDATSGLSPYLHFGHISVHEVMAQLFDLEQWSMDRLSRTANGRRDGWWGMSEPAEAFIDELVTWRELGYHFCFHRPDYDQYDSLPAWARRTLAEHAADAREHVYSLEQLEQARTHDPLWNAAQWQLLREGRIHNYLRMLWGKKILEWSESPQQALQSMVELNNKYALDGRDPNSYSGIFWVLGRFDRAWGPERSIYGKVRYMSSTNTARKLRVTDYIRRYA